MVTYFISEVVPLVGLGSLSSAQVVMAIRVSMAYTPHIGNYTPSA